MKQEELLTMKFDQLLTFLNDLTKSEIFSNVNFLKYIKGELDPILRNTIEMQKEINDIKNLKRGIQEFKITNTTLNRMENEFNQIKSNVASLLAFK